MKFVKNKVIYGYAHINYFGIKRNKLVNIVFKLLSSIKHKIYQIS